MLGGGIRLGLGGGGGGCRGGYGGQTSRLAVRFLVLIGALARSTISGSRSVSTLSLSPSCCWLFDTNRTLPFACASFTSKGVGLLATVPLPPLPNGLAILTCSSRGTLGSGESLVVILVVVVGVQSESLRLKRWCVVVAAILLASRLK